MQARGTPTVSDQPVDPGAQETHFGVDLSGSAEQVG